MCKEKFHRIKSVLERFQMSKSGWYAGVADGIYPPPVKMGVRTSAWRESDLDELAELFCEGKTWRDREAQS